MKDFRAKLALSLYTGLGLAVRPAIYPYLRYRAAHGKEIPQRRKERLGRSTYHRPAGSLIWLHAASVGETVALIPLIEHILTLRFNVLITTATITAAAIIEKRFGLRVHHQFCPFDIKPVLRRFLDHWRPDLVLICESEVWPMRIDELARRQIPQILLNAHLSEKSYQAWKRRPQLANYIFSKLDLVIAQTEQGGQNFRDLGVRYVEISGNLKADAAVVEDREQLETFRSALTGRSSWAAISTHEGEEIIAAEVHSALKPHVPDLLTIIVPRHPERFNDVAMMLAQRNLNVLRKSEGQIPDSNTDILLGDTIGEMGLYLRLTEIAFVGKSLSAAGGHNPLEPALAGAAIISGPKYENFQDTYQRLVSDDAARVVEDATQLAVQVNLLLTQPAIRTKLINNARRSAARMSGALGRTLLLLQPFLDPLAMRARLAYYEATNGN